MHIILLSGGSGKRLWPLSNDVRSKQFLKVFRAPGEARREYESMLQRVYRQLRSVSPDATVTVATGESQVSAIRNQLGDQVGVCVEPSRRDTFPAIALAAAYLHSERGLSRSDVVVVCPIDPYVNADYFEALRRLEEAAQSPDAALTLMGVRPTVASEKYGYIIPEPGASPVRRVLSFQEKPNAETAARYIARGALWNCGVFAFRLGYLLDILRSYLPFDRYREVYDHYAQLPRLSFDYAVVEKENNVKCIEFAGQWKDVGTWKTLAEAMDTPVIGNVTLGEKCEDVQVVNEVDVPLLVLGARHMVVAASADGILVCAKECGSSLKSYVDRINRPARYQELAWGTLTVLHRDERAATVKLDVAANQTLDEHCHDDRDEVWTVLCGEGEAVVDGQATFVRAGDVMRLPRGVCHSLRSRTAMRLIETRIQS